MRKKIYFIAATILMLTLGVSSGAANIQERVDENRTAPSAGISKAPEMSIASSSEDYGSSNLLDSPQTPNACPPNPTGLPDSIEPAGEQFCVFYNSADTTLAQAQQVADDVIDYWDQYVAYGFLPPLVSGVKLSVEIVDAGCNGVAFDNYARVNNGCFTWDEYMQYVVGHELFHRVQFNHDPDFLTTWSNSAWVYEGTARAMEDAAFANIDTWANCTLPTFSYCNEVNDYLVSTNADITSWGMRYQSALWWTFFREQFGSVPTEPQLGVDAWVALWNAMATQESVAAVNSAMSSLSAGMNFNEAFRRFAVAIWTKDLTGLPDDSYNFIDEDQTGNPAAYGPLTPSLGGTINATTSASWNNQNVSKYGARYYAASPDSANCPVITASFHKDMGPDAFYHVVTEKGTAFGTHREGSGTDWKQSFLNDGITQIVAIIGGQGNAAQVDVTLSCADPVLDIKQPNTLAPEFVGAYNDQDKFIAQVLVTNGAPDAPVVAGLTNSDFSAEVGGIPALVVGGGFVQEQYFLQIQAPVQPANGPYDLEIFLEEPGTSNVIASDTETDAILYDNTNSDNVLVIDRSGSMGWYADPPINAAKAAANMFVDIMNSSEGLSVVGYNGDINPPPLGMQFATLPHRTNAHTFINGLVASGSTSIGDGLQEAVNQRAASPTGNTGCSFVLLSDGMENTPAFWADVQAAVVGSGCSVMSIAFGQGADEPLMQAIASATGGLAFYNDVFVSIPGSTNAFSPDDMFLDLASTYEYAQAQTEGRQRLLSEKGEIPTPVFTQTHQVMIDNSISEALFLLDWNQIGIEMLFQLRKPDGTIINPYMVPYDFEDYYPNYHLGWRIADPEPGEWELLVTHLGGAKAPVPYQVLVSGKSNLTALLLLPDQVGAIYLTGDYIPLYAILSADMPIGSAMLQAIVTAPDNTETLVPLFDDGQHDDGAAGDGFYAGLYTLVNQAEAVQPPPEEGGQDPPAGDEGAYRVRLLASGPEFQRESLGSFAVYEGEDANSNGIPDNYEETYGDPGEDPDLDLLVTGDEYFAGTDPNDSDTDDGGENDWSEVVLHGLDPFDPSDDEIEEPDHFQVEPKNGAVRLSFDVKGEYMTMRLFRATSSAGPWNLRVAELPLTGIYTDTATNDQTFYYRLLAIDPEDHWSAVLDSEPVMPKVDPVAPEALVLINDGAASTTSLSVTLSFYPYMDGGEEAFEDITEVLVSNDPSFSSAVWQPFAQDLPWQLAPTQSGQSARVYTRFKDGAENESLVVTDDILFEGSISFLPLISR